MEVFLQSMGYVLFFLCSSYGLGNLIVKSIYNREPFGFAYSSTIGITILIVYGGILNALQIVSRLSLHLALFLGFGLFLVFFLQSCMARGRNALKGNSVKTSFLAYFPNILTVYFPLYLLVFIVLSFCVYSLMPSDAFNYHDDFHNYLHPSVQLLDSGGFKPNIFSAIGYNSIGGHIFMKSIIHLYLDVDYANTFDGVICFILGLVLILEIGRKTSATAWSIITAMILYLFINPQIVNTSSAYSGTLMVIGLLYSNVLLDKKISALDRPGFNQITALAIPVALFYCAIATLKATFIIFAALFFTVKLLYDLLFRRSRKTVLFINSIITIVSMILLLPWLLASSTQYFDILFQKFSPGETGTSLSIDTVQMKTSDFGSLFSSDKLFWGNSYPDYLALFAALAFTTAVFLYFFLRNRSHSPSEEGIVISSGTLAAILSLCIIITMIDTATALRYILPVLIGILPFLTICIGGKSVKDYYPVPSLFWIAVIGLHLGIGIMFTNTFLDRIQRMASGRTLISFPVNDSYYKYMNFVFGGEREKQIREIQEVTDKGSHIMAWISTPFFLDFARNEITTIEAFGGVGGAFLNEIPFNEDIGTFRQFFRKRDVDYIMWEYAGYAVKKEGWYRQNWGEGAARAQYFIKTLPLLAEKTRVVYHKNRIVLMDIREWNVR